MATDNVTPLRPGSEPPPPTTTPSDPRVATYEEQVELAGHLMSQAVKAAILLLADGHPQELAADVLRLARDRWDRDGVWPELP